MSKKVYRCPFGNRKYYEKAELYEHMEVHHRLDLQGLPAARVYFNMKYNKVHGKCVICKSPTNWNDRTERYERLCEKPSCKRKYVDMFRARMNKKYGKTTLLNDPEFQKKMLKNRKISGEYKWEDGTIHEYTGSYEYDFLMFMENVLNWKNPNDILMPAARVFEYTLDKKKRFYIPDVYITSIDLHIEIKGSNNHYQKRDKPMELAKDNMMKKRKDVNYVKVLDRDYSDLISFMHKKINGTTKYVLKEEYDFFMGSFIEAAKVLNEDKHDPYDVKANNSKMIYHASSFQNIKKLEVNRSKVVHTKNFVPKIYASEDISFASAFSFKWGEADIKLYRKDKKQWTIEIPNNMKDVLKAKASMYFLEPDNFKKAYGTVTPEVIATVDVPVVKEVKYDSALQCMELNGVDVKYVKSVIKEDINVKDSIYLATHNEFKIKEFNKYSGGKFIMLDNVPDLKEIESKDLLEIVKYKTMDMYEVMQPQLNNNKLLAIEDTSLSVDGLDVGGNIRWLISKLSKYKDRLATMSAIVGITDGEYIRIFRGDIEGRMVKKRGTGYGFDPYFEVRGPGLTMAEIKTNGGNIEAKYSTRRILIDKIRNNDFVEEIKISDLPKWKGKYQH